MPEENNAQPRRYCTNCGTEVRPNNAFCTSCGASLASPPAAGSGQTDPRAPSPGSASSFADALSSAFRRVSGSLRGPSLPGVGSASGIPGRAWRRFRGLPLAAQAALAALVLLSLLAILSPLGAVLAAVVFGVSLIVVVVRVAQRRPAVGWGATAATSLVLAFALWGLSGVLYGGGSTAETDGDAGIGGAPGSAGATDPAEGSGYDPAYQYGPDEGGESSPCDLVVPELQGLAEQWASREDVSGSLYLPSYLPFEVDSVSDWEGGYPPLPTLYEIRSGDTTVTLEFMQDSPYTSDMPEELAAVQTVTMADGVSRPYIITRDAPEMGGYGVAFGPAVGGRPVRLQQHLVTYFGTMTPEEFFDMFSSMVEIEPSGGTGC